MKNFLRQCWFTVVRVFAAYVIALGIGLIMTSSWWWQLGGAVTALVGIRIIELNAQAYQVWRQYPYYWHCDRCIRNKRKIYFVRAADEQARDEFRDNHNRLVHLEER